MADLLKERAQDECFERVPHHQRRNWLDNKDISKSMPERLVAGLCAEDDAVTVLRTSRILMQQHLDSATLPPPRKFTQGSYSSTDLTRSRSAVPFCSGAAANYFRKELQSDSAQRRSSDPSSWSSASLHSIRVSLMGDELHLCRPPSLADQWESLMTKSAAETEKAADDEHPSHPPSDIAPADAPPSPRAQHSPCVAAQCTHWAACDRRAREAK